MMRATAPRGRRPSPLAGKTPPSWPFYLAALVALLIVLLPSAVSDLKERTDRWAWDRSPSTPWVLEAPTGTRSTPPADIVFMIDESGSVASSDPGRARWVQTQELQRFMSTYMPQDRLTVGTFATSASRLDPPTNPSLIDLDSVANRRINPGSTNVAPPVRKAEQVFEHGDSSRQRIIVLFTDGDADDIGEAINLLRPDTLLIVFGLDDDGTWSRSRKRWPSDRFQSTTVKGSARSIAQAQVQLLETITGQTIGTHQQPYPGDSQ